MDIVLISAAAGMATGLGAVLVLLTGRPSRSLMSAMLGFAGGIMLAISAFDLMPEAATLSSEVYAVVGFFAGALLMFGLDIVVPHLHIGEGQGENSKDSEMLRIGFFIFLGIALHNLPEGLAIGAGYSANIRLGGAIALALAVHNIPEGMATAMPLLAGGMGRLKVVGLAILAGLMTPVGTVIGRLLIDLSGQLVGVSLAFAAGAMVYIVSDELIPQSHRFHSHWANLGLLTGFILGFLIS